MLTECFSQRKQNTTHLAGRRKLFEGVSTAVWGLEVLV